MVRYFGAYLVHAHVTLLHQILIYNKVFNRLKMLFKVSASCECIGIRRLKLNKLHLLNEVGEHRTMGYPIFNRSNPFIVILLICAFLRFSDCDAKSVHCTPMAR